MSIEIESPYEVIEVLFERNYPGYIYRRELIESSFGDNDILEMINCYSSDTGHWIGDAKDARLLCKKRGIRNLQKIDPTNCVCSIGFNEKEQKWYGWSHRAIFGFGIGSKVKKGDCAYEPNNKENFIEDARNFWVDGNSYDVVVERDVEDPYKDQDGLGVCIHTNIKQDKTGKILSGEHWEPYPTKWGKGEWVAKTLDDAKQIAIDFSKGVS